MRINPSSATVEFLESVCGKVNARNKAVLGKSGLFLALSRGVPRNFKISDAQGAELAEETIVGDELLSVVRAALNHRLGRTLNEIEYKQAFRLYFEYGCHCLKQIWDECSGDRTLFVASLLKVSNFSFGDSSVPLDNKFNPIIENLVTLKILVDESPWPINASGGNGLMVISGKPGTGKSQLALDLLGQLSRQGVRFLFFDLKGELEEDILNPTQIEKRGLFFDLTKARYTRLISDSLPINPLFQGANQVENAQIASEVGALIRAFAPQLGVNQERTIRDAYEVLAIPDFPTLANELELQGENGVAFSIIDKISRFNIFATSINSVPIMHWLSHSQVIDFKPLGNDNETKSLVVAFILNILMRQMNRTLPIKNGIQPLQMVLFVDEAHLLLPKEGKSGLLGSLARQGRSWGFPIWLASQDADAFITSGANATNFADLASCGVHFSPQNLSDSEQRAILGQVIHRQLQTGEAALRLESKLLQGQARQFWHHNADYK